MIRRHDFNSAWCGAEAGIVEDEALFHLAAAERDSLLRPWAFVEARGALDPDRVRALFRSGFFLADTQVPFRIGLTRLTPTPSLANLRVESAAEHPFEVSSPAPFLHERFAYLPGIEAPELERRYTLWSRTLVEEHPEHALRITSEHGTEGWFLSRPTEHGFELTLAMLAQHATITGHHLYHRALLAYRERGLRVGHAAFSISNTPVHNIYAALRARFLPPEGCWLWFPGSDPTQPPTTPHP